MLRVLHLSPRKELLLKPKKDGNGLHGFSEDKGIIERLAQAEFEAFAFASSPQMVSYIRLQKLLTTVKLSSVGLNLHAYSGAGV